MKLVVMVTLLLSDADVLFTFASFHSYLKKGFVVAPVMISTFVLVYLAGAYFGNKKKKQFCKTLRENVEAGSYKKRDRQTLTLADVKGQTEDEFKKTMLSEGLGNKFFQERAKFVRNIVKMKHSVPFFRLAKFGWMADIPASDFAGILNANALYSFTLGLPQLGFSLFFWLKIIEGQEDLLIMSSLTVSVLSLILSIMNILVAFPKVLNDLECERDLRLEMDKDIESRIKAHVDGMRQELDEKLQQYIGKADHTEDYIKIMQEFKVVEEKLRKAVTEMVESDYARGAKDDRI